MDKKVAQAKVSVPNNRLFEARRARGWRQQDVADQLGVSLDAVRKWERGSRFPSLKKRVQLSELFGLSAAEIGLETVEETELMDVPFEEQELTRRVDLGREKINRRRMIGRVRAIWMSILGESLHKAALIALGLQDLPWALENPWRLAVPQSDRSSQLLPPGTSIIE